MSVPSFNEVDVRESPMNVIEGGTYKFNVPGYAGAVTVDASSFMYTYRGSSDVSATVLSDSLVATGTTLALKTISGLVGGSPYRHVWGVTCGGVRKVYGLTMNVLRKYDVTGATYNSVDVEESVINVIEGGEHIYTITYPDVIDTTGGWIYSYKRSTDTSSTNLSGSLSGNGTNVLTIKTIGSLLGGNKYRIVWAVTCQGQIEPYGLVLDVSRKNGR